MPIPLVAFDGRAFVLLILLIVLIAAVVLQMRKHAEGSNSLPEMHEDPPALPYDDVN